MGEYKPEKDVADFSIGQDVMVNGIDRAGVIVGYSRIHNGDYLAIELPVGKEYPGEWPGWSGMNGTDTGFIIIRQVEDVEAIDE